MEATSEPLQGESADRETSPAPEAEQETPAPEAEQETPAPEAEQETPAPEAEQQAPAPEAEQQTPAPEAEQQAPAPEAEQEPSEGPVTVEAPAPAAAGEPVGDTTALPVAVESEPVTDLKGEPTSGADATPGEPGSFGRPAEGKAAWRRLLRMGLPRATKANVLAGLLAVLLGAAIATQVQLTQERGLSELSQSDLIRVLDDVSVRSSRLDDQIRELEITRDRLKSGAGSSAEALSQAQKRADTLGILAGTVGATGPGVIITVSDPRQAVSAPIILDLIQELRDAGAEAIEVGGVRVVASSFVGEIDKTITIDGVRIPRPIKVKAIGEAKTLSSAMTIPGGIVETVRQRGATATVTEQDTVEITSLHSAQEPKDARVAP